MRAPNDKIFGLEHGESYIACHFSPSIQLALRSYKLSHSSSVEPVAVDFSYAVERAEEETL